MASRKAELEHLLSGEKQSPDGKDYYTTVYVDEQKNSIIYCCHGLKADLCCEKKQMQQKNKELSGSNKLDSIKVIGGQLCGSVSGPARDDEHCHSPAGGPPSVDKRARRKLIIASILCLLFMLLEAVGGFLANSLAIATDAAHLLSDFASFMISLFAIYLGSRPASKRMNFGWYRAEVIGALTSVLMIWLVTGILLYVAVERLLSAQYDIDATLMLITAAVGVGVNLIMGCALHDVPHGHSHGGSGGESDHSHSHSHSSGDSSGESGGGHGGHGGHSKNINVRAAFIHVLGDFFQSLGVLIAATVIYFYPSMSYIDPICTFLFSILVLFTTYNIMKDVINVLMEGIPKGIDFLDVQRTLFEIEGVQKVHNLRIWALSLDKIALSTHLAIGNEIEPAKVLKRASHILRTRFNIYDLTIQVEEYKDEMMNCTQCQSIE